MKVSELIDRTVTLLKLVASKSVKQAAEADLIMQELFHLKGWAYPHLTTEDIVQVVRCKKCKHYKKYKKKDNPKAAPFWACSLTKLKHDPMFYCKDGMEK